MSEILLLLRDKLTTNNQQYLKRYIEGKVCLAIFDIFSFSLQSSGKEKSLLKMIFTQENIFNLENMILTKFLNIIILGNQSIISSFPYRDQKSLKLVSMYDSVFHSFSCHFQTKLKRILFINRSFHNQVLFSEFQPKPQ